MSTALLTVLVLLSGCAEKTEGNETGPPVASPDDTHDQTDSAPIDLDGDGYVAEDDCDDGRSDIFPGAEELCNGLDDNCNGVIDEAFPDIDDDGVADCQDSEECDGADNDGDGAIDEGLEDIDGDGTPDCVDSEECDGVDNDADGRVDEGFDMDGDGFTSCDSDCDDGDPAINPDAAEVDGDNLDNDCDGNIDQQTWAEGELIIVEVMVNPGAVADPQGEWFEIVNTTERTVWLNGLILQSTVDADYHQIRSSDKLVVAPGATALLGSNWNYDTNGGVHLDYTFTDVSLANEADDLLITAGPTVIDQVAWSSDGLVETQGATLNLDPWFYDAAANDVAGNWCSATEFWLAGGDRGSPGIENEVCVMDHDGDGYQGIEDCDDYDASVNPDEPMPLNQRPIARAGADQTYSESVTCVSTGYDYECDDCADHVYTLDGSASSDADGHELRYAWTLVDGEDVATLKDEDQVVATLQIDGPSTEYGEMESSTVTVQLTVTDCADATGTDQLVLTFECTGE